MHWDPVVTMERMGAVPLHLAGGRGEKREEKPLPPEPDFPPDVPNENRRLMDAWGRPKSPTEGAYRVLVDLYKVSRPKLDDAGRYAGMVAQSFRKDDLVEPGVLTPELAAQGIADGEIREVTTKRLMCVGGVPRLGPPPRPIIKNGFNCGMDMGGNVVLSARQTYGLAVDFTYELPSERDYIDGELLERKYQHRRYLFLGVPPTVEGGLYPTVPIWPNRPGADEFKPRENQCRIRLLVAVGGREAGDVVWAMESQALQLIGQGKASLADGPEVLSKEARGRWDENQKGG
jgi:hypothetical protein